VDIRENTVVIEDEDMRDYQKARNKKRKPDSDWDSFVLPSSRGKNVEEYMREMREDDRI